MHPFVQRYATPLITGLFCISLVSGVALFTHVGQSYFRGVHEWLSMVVIVPFVLHLWRNWRAFTNYFSKGPFIAAMVLSLGAATAFALQSGAGQGGDGPPQFALVKALTANPPNKVAALLGYTPESLAAHLKAEGFTIEDAGQTLADIASKSGKDDFALAAALTPPVQ